jgi:hypothetical protein
VIHGSDSAIMRAQASISGTPHIGRITIFESIDPEPHFDLWERHPAAIHPPHPASL